MSRVRSVALEDGLGAVEALFNQNQSTEHYARLVNSPMPAVASPLMRKAQGALASSLAEISKTEVGRAEVDEFLSSACSIQTGPHLKFALDSDYFSTLLFSSLGARSVKSGVSLIFNCATVKLEERSKVGPAWPLMRNNRVRGFNLPRRTLARTPVLCSEQLCTLDSGFLDALAADFPRVENNLTEIEESRTVVGHFDYVNTGIFQRVFDLCGVRTVSFDERHLARALQGSLIGDTMLGRIIDDGRIVDMVRHLRTLQLRRPSLPLGVSTELFWLRDGERLRSLTIDSKTSTLVSSDASVRIPLTRIAIAEALIDGQIVPGLLIDFLMISLFPGNRVIGGPFQALYFDAYLEAYTSILDSNDSDEHLINRYFASARVNYWGHKLISSDAVDTRAMRTGGSLNSLLDRVASSSLRTVSNEFRSLFENSAWLNLSSSSSGGHIRSDVFE